MRARVSARLFTVATLMVAFALLGCGGAGGSDPTNPDSEAGITYTVTPSTLLLAPGQSGTAIVTVTRSSNFTGDLALQVGGLFQDVTGTFSPATLSAGTSSATLTITAGTGGANFGTMTLEVQPTLNGKRVNLNGTLPTFTATVSIRPTVVVNKGGTGSGSVTSSPAGINCGNACQATFLFVPITLTATPAAGSAFTGWSGACAGTTLTCTFTPRVTASSNFNFTTATFTSAP